jgi:hypothetical protein
LEDGFGWLWRDEEGAEGLEEEGEEVPGAAGGAGPSLGCGRPLPLPLLPRPADDCATVL